MSRHCKTSCALTPVPQPHNHHESQNHGGFGSCGVFGTPWLPKFSAEEKSSAQSRRLAEEACTGGTFVTDEARATRATRATRAVDGEAWERAQLLGGQVLRSQPPSGRRPGAGAEKIRSLPAARPPGPGPPPPRRPARAARRGGGGRAAEG